MSLEATGKLIELKIVVFVFALIRLLVILWINWSKLLSTDYFHLLAIIMLSLDLATTDLISTLERISVK